MGAVFSAAFSADAPLLVAAGGAKGTVAVWDSFVNETVAEFVSRRAPTVAAAASAHSGVGDGAD